MELPLCQRCNSDLVIIKKQIFMDDGQILFIVKCKNCNALIRATYSLKEVQNLDADKKSFLKPLSQKDKKIAKKSSEKWVELQLKHPAKKKVKKKNK